MESQKITQFITVVVLASTWVLASFSYAFADDRYDELPPAERFNLRIGGFLIGSFDTTARFDSAHSSTLKITSILTPAKPFCVSKDVIVLTSSTVLTGAITAVGGVAQPSHRKNL